MPSWRSAVQPTARSELRNTIQVEPLAFRPDAPLEQERKEGPPPVAPPQLQQNQQQHQPPPPLPREETAFYYGTRLSTVVLIRRDGATTLVERDVWTLDPARGGGAPAHAPAGRDRVFRFQIERGPR